MHCGWGRESDCKGNAFRGKERVSGWGEGFSNEYVECRNLHTVDVLTDRGWESCVRKGSAWGMNGVCGGLTVGVDGGEGGVSGLPVELLQEAPGLKCCCLMMIL